MLHMLVPPEIKRIIASLEPIDVRLGASKLKAYCSDVLGIEPEPTTAFLFTNRDQTTLLLYFVDANGDRLLSKHLDSGAFLLPTPTDSNQRVVTIPRSKLNAILRA